MSKDTLYRWKTIEDTRAEANGDQIERFLRSVISRLVMEDDYRIDLVLKRYAESTDNRSMDHPTGIPGVEDSRHKKRSAPKSGRAVFFKKGAYLYSTPKELSEADFIKLAASGHRGMDYLMEFLDFPYVSLVLDDPHEPLLVGHTNGRTIALVMSNHKNWQTMEWK